MSPPISFGAWFQGEGGQTKIGCGRPAIKATRPGPPASTPDEPAGGPAMRPEPAPSPTPADRAAPAARPDRRAVMRQDWSLLSFLHWEVPADRLRALLPPGLDLDLHEGRAFVGLVPFT